MEGGSICVSVSGESCRQTLKLRLNTKRYRGCHIWRYNEEVWESPHVLPSDVLLRGSYVTSVTLAPGQPVERGNQRDPPERGTDLRQGVLVHVTVDQQMHTSVVHARKSTEVAGAAGPGSRYRQQRRTWSGRSVAREWVITE